MNQPARIFVSYSGASKGVLAQALAEELDWNFMDADFSLVPLLGVIWLK